MVLSTMHTIKDFYASSSHLDHNTLYNMSMLPKLNYNSVNSPVIVAVSKACLDNSVLVRQEEKKYGIPEAELSFALRHSNVNRLCHVQNKT